MTIELSDCGLIVGLLIYMREQISSSYYMGAHANNQLKGDTILLACNVDSKSRSKRTQRLVIPDCLVVSLKHHAMVEHLMQNKIK